MNSSTTLANWLRASSELDFVFTAPFSFTHADETYSCFGYLPEFGSNKGMMVILEYDEKLLQACQKNGYAYSCLSDSDEAYDVRDIMDVLNDWGWSSKMKPTPHWYTGIPWTT